MIERKKYPCKQCGASVFIRSKGLCPLCRSKELAQNAALEQASLSPKKAKAPIKKKQVESCLDVYFDFHISEIAKFPYCMETGDYINQGRFNVAHLFSKSKHPNTRCCLENAVYLSWQSHFDFDKLLDSKNFKELETWKIWPQVLYKMRLLLPQVDNTNFKQAFEEYLQEYDTLNLPY